MAAAPSAPKARALLLAAAALLLALGCATAATEHSNANRKLLQSELPAKQRIPACACVVCAVW